MKMNASMKVIICEGLNFWEHLELYNGIGRNSIHAYD